MPYLQLFEAPLCCPTGVCGPETDDALVRITADLAWLRRAGVNVDRYNLAQQPMAFVQTAKVRSWLEERGMAGLPLLLVDGDVAISARYPSRADLARLVGLESSPLETASCRAGAGCC